MTLRHIRKIEQGLAIDMKHKIVEVNGVDPFDHEVVFRRISLNPNVFKIDLSIVRLIKEALTVLAKVFIPPFKHLFTCLRIRNALRNSQAEFTRIGIPLIVRDEVIALVAINLWQLETIRN